MSIQKTKTAARAVAMLLAVLLCGLTLCVSARPARAAEWMEPYLEQVQEWGVMRGDSSGNLNADREITRAEFVTLINRAFGYTDVGPNPFSDVLPTDWFAEDIAIAHQAGYFNGTSPTTASPLNYVTREQAAALLGRSLRLQGTPGSNTTFDDGNQIGTWSRALVQEAADLGIIQGYSDGTFRPMERITRGQVACFLVRALGTLINEPGEQTAGGVYGNLTINTAGVKLKDTTITGNLYLTGGVGLGNIELENVNVLGKIVLCGAGEAEKGENSVVLRNVIADSFEVDSLTDQFLTVRAEGLTDIANTTVRTSSYLEDLTDDGLGLRRITLDGASGVQLQVAGNIKEIHNLTPNSDLQIAQGVANVVTMDEKATGARLNIDNSASIRELNLDTGIPVTGTGSISHLNVNAAGSNVESLPDTITVRPGINSNINRQTMDATAAAESSEDPRILSGYPAARDVAPTTASAVFSTNKTGTIHWALTALTDGSLGETELMNPSAYSARIIRNGTLNATASNTEFTARLTGLTRDGSYYVSALLVDARGRRSPVKVTAFTTPDDSTPAFASGYPYTIMSTDKDNEQVVQVMAMPTKDCKLYYALLPNNSAAPTQDELKSAAVTGNLGYGVVDVKRNTPLLIPQVNTSYLEEQTTYSLYLWLNDADNGKSSAIRRLQVTTLDKTPPTITSLTHIDSAARTATFTVTLDEPGTLYWAVVRANVQFYASVPGENRIPEPQETIAKIQIENGTNAVRKGNVNVARAATEVRFTVSGLDAQTHYDLYYVAKDRAGNYNIYTESLTPPLEFSTLDNVPPTVTQEFTHDGTDEGQRNPTPYPDTDINLVFSEMVQGFEYINGVPNKEPFMELYTAVDTALNGSEEKREAKEKLGETLRKYIKLWYRPASGQPVQVPVAGDPDVGDDWVIDYREAVIKPDPEGTGEMILTFPNGTGLKLGSGVTYYFTLENIADTSQAANRMQGTRGVVTLPNFTTIDAQLIFSRGSATGGDITFDMNFRLSPVTTENSSTETLWDMIFWSENTMEFELYYRQLPGDSWELMGKAAFRTTDIDRRVGLSISREMLSANKDIPSFEQLRSFRADREYGIRVTSLNGNPTRSEWSGSGSITIVPVAGDQGSLTVLANTGNLTPESYKNLQSSNNAVKEIGVPTEYTVTCPFRDTNPPMFIDDYPAITPGDTGAIINVMLNRPNSRYYYVIAPLGYIPTTIKTGDTATSIGNNADLWESLLPEDGEPFNRVNAPNATLPVSNTITSPSGSVESGSGRFNGVMSTITIPQDTLLPKTKYIIYFVLQGESTESISDVYAIRFETEEVVRPILSISLANPSATIRSDREAKVNYALLVAGRQDSIFAEHLSQHLNNDAVSSNPDLWRSDYGDMTLLEAMRASVTENNRDIGSVFDLFALQTTKDDVSSTIISGASTSLIATSGETTLTQRNNLSFTNNFTSSMTMGTDYWIVAVGRSPVGSGYAFRSNRYLSIRDEQHPMVTDLSTTFLPDIPPSENPNDIVGPFSGELTITFDEDLYYKESAEVWKMVADVQAATGNNQVSSSSLLGKSDRVYILFSGDVPCRTLRLKFEGIGIGESIQMNPNLADDQGNTGQGDGTLTFRLEVMPNQYGAYRPQFIITNSGWDAIPTTRR